jgi:tetratricopeptide (TPR) repeat protein
MKKFFLLMAALVALPVMARAASLDDANAAFAAGKFAEATAAYESVLKTDGYSAPVLFDLGNSYVREGSYPQAILAYKRALWLAPNDEDILANLRTAQQQAGTAVEQRPALEKAAGAMSVNGWAWLGCAGRMAGGGRGGLRVRPRGRDRGDCGDVGWAARRGGGGQESAGAGVAIPGRGRAGGLHAGAGGDGEDREGV